MMMVMLCAEGKGEGELIGMSGLGDVRVGGRCAQAKGEGAGLHISGRTGLAAAAISIGMGSNGL